MGRRSSTTSSSATSRTTRILTTDARCYSSPLVLILNLLSFGSSCIQHSVLRYDSVSILLTLAVFDGALNPDDLTRMLNNGGAGQVEWSERCRDLPICRSVNHSGDVHDTKPMTEDTFIDIRLQKIMLEEHRREFSASLKRHKLFSGRQAQLPNPDLDDLIHELRLEMARLAQKMTRTSPAIQQERLDAMEDMLSLLAAPTVYYRPREEPQDGKYPYCSKEIQR